MNYTVQTGKDEDDNYYWSVLEKPTDQVIDSFVFEDDAKEYCKFLNRGGGFCGFTPAFMLTQINVPVQRDINLDFAKVAM